MEKENKIILDEINKHRTRSNHQVFAKGWCFAKIFMLFVIGCIIGTYYEQFLYLFRSGIWESRQGIIYGPFNPIYGFGFAAFGLFLGKNVATRKWYWTYLYACILGGITEFSLSWIGETLFHANSWDYSTYFLNIGGRTTIPYMLFWGLGGLLFMQFIYPFLSKLIEMIPYKIGKIGLPIFVTFMVLNMVVSYSALFRQAQRQMGNPPISIVGEIYDKIYTDEFLKTVYPNMVHDVLENEK